MPDTPLTQLVEWLLPPSLFSWEKVQETGPLREDTLDLALHSRVAPLLYDRLEQSPLKDQVPPDKYRQLAVLHLKVLSEQQMLLEAYRSLLNLFRQRGIPSAPLKGVALHQSLYQKPGLRPFGDIDLLIPVRRISSAIALLEEEGYSLQGRGGSGEWFLRKGPVYLDLHQTLDAGGRFRIPAEEVWATACPKGDCLFELPPVVHLIHSLLHGLRHAFESLQPLVDALWLWCLPEVGHQEVWLKQKGIQWQCYPAIAISLQFLHHFFASSEIELPQLPLEGWRRWVIKAMLPVFTKEYPGKQARWRRLILALISTNANGWFRVLKRKFSLRR